MNAQVFLMMVDMSLEISVDNMAFLPSLPQLLGPMLVKVPVIRKPAPVKVCNGGTEKDAPMQRADIPDGIPVIAAAFSGDKGSLRDNL